MQQTPDNALKHGAVGTTHYDDQSPARDESNAASARATQLVRNCKSDIKLAKNRAIGSNEEDFTRELVKTSAQFAAKDITTDGVDFSRGM